MKSNLGLKTMFAAGLVTTLLAGTALAAPIAPVPLAPPTTAEESLALQPLCVYGKATAITDVKNGARILLENSNDKDPNQKIDVIVSDQTMILDAVTGNTKTIKDIKTNETIYAYVGPAMAMSMPPQASATLILCNIPADFAVPHYAEVQTITPMDNGKIDVLMTPSVILHLDKDTKLLAYRSDKVVNLGDITVGSHLLSWYTKETRSSPGQATPTKVMLFPKSAPVLPEPTPVLPGTIMTRGAFVERLYVSANSPAVTGTSPFADAQTDAFNWASAQKIATGTATNTFNPNDDLTREQMMMFLLRYATAIDKGPQGSWAVRISYQDVADIAPWATSGAMWNEITKLIPPDADNRILPTAKVTHGEATAAIAGLLAR